jgi:hypothetical protein
MSDSVISEVNKIIAILVDVLQRHENEIYRLKILNTALGQLTRKALLGTEYSVEQYEPQLRESLVEAEKSAPPQDHPDLEKEIQELLKTAAELENQLKSQKPN